MVHNLVSKLDKLENIILQLTENLNKSQNIKTKEEQEFKFKCQTAGCGKKFKKQAYFISHCKLKHGLENVDQTPTKDVGAQDAFELQQKILPENNTTAGVISGGNQTVPDPGLIDLTTKSSEIATVANTTATATEAPTTSGSGCKTSHSAPDSTIVSNSSSSDDGSIRSWVISDFGSWPLFKSRQWKVNLPSKIKRKKKKKENEDKTKNN